MSSPPEMASDLRAHLALCEHCLLLVERESQALRDRQPPADAEFQQFRQALLPRLDQSVARLKQHRAAWQRLCPDERQQNPEIASLLRLNQDLIMKVILLDRENEHARLRRGLLSPQQLPPAHRQRPHFVAELYRRGSH